MNSWPFKEGKRHFTSKTNMAQMRAVLLNPAYGFTKPPQAPASKQVVAQRSNTVSADGPIPPPPPAPPSASSPTPTPPSPSALPSSQPTAIETEHLAGTKLEHGAGMDLGSCTLPGLSPFLNAICHLLNPFLRLIQPGWQSDQMLIFMWTLSVLVPTSSSFAYLVTLEQVGALNDLTGEWQGSAVQLVERLHEKAPGIEDALEIMYPDPAHPEYLRWLVSATAGGLMHSAPDAPSIHIPADNVLTLCVRFGQFQIVQMREAATAASTAHGQHCTTASDSHKPQSCTAAAWLAEKAQEEPGLLCNSAKGTARSHVRSVNQVTAASLGALKEDRTSRKKMCRMPLEWDQRGWPKHSKQCTSCWQYGEGGSSPRQAVIAKCASTSEKAGAQDLLAYLRLQ
ncbi:hypothetical protein DFJ58DRAFT_837733 [Suillus subalutaceus]|uniref:uncharacterized protein n=1 Tax=Suillus subalutaceus TaxID=48586 RepID=UPI001B862DC1|nr:uncharacterized protein DFJ58DRAFT_837733 [Suillus subalutaceus]KAG1869437.1 hypothetical protein DFJ58DRAFT_837733 [Suillus subalutaceus]